MRDRSTSRLEQTINTPILASCEDERLGLSPADLLSQLPVPAVYGGDGQIKEIAAGCAGIAASATALTQFIHLHAVWGNGPRPAKSPYLFTKVTLTNRLLSMTSRILPLLAVALLICIDYDFANLLRII